MAKEEKTLSEQDRQRIRQKAQQLVGSDDYAAARKAGFRAGAEYEHKYQREQQEGKLDEHYRFAVLANDNYNNLQKRFEALDTAYIELESKCIGLEAERTELRNKVIEEIIQEMFGITMPDYVERHIIQKLKLP